ncbi:metalloregulator ArsR/SmtB family transcription factor [Gracilibacillus salitolerans]|uniref:Metalloregulator ArsR/SmtB family transcription factor n=1 Tax=Gracilibacillus salitolerans TaxID=2663022 RepID=A0A5Q2TFQ0_9BACI|nr:metalloregulator ArsR/SmtB family transcription factor [Gracilibacillus salitolerans]QGH32823.1 metalloregulator ArsR/SmtB family transcription factor [Gracilibacillus salitolerans]
MSDQAKHDVFQAISDPNRRTLLKILDNKEMFIAEITDYSPISRTAVNKHLHILSNAGVVTSRKVGREIRYTLKPEPLVEIKVWLMFFEQYWDVKLSALKKYVEEDNE